MPKAQSQMLLGLIREAMKRRSWNTAALAGEMGEGRARVRELLSGREPLLVDDFFAMLEALKMGPEELGVVLPAGVEAAAEASQPQASEAPKESDPTAGPSLLRAAPEEEPLQEPEDPRCHTEQLLRLGFGQGIDMLFMAITSQLKQSGLPLTVLARFPDLLPIKLDAAYHRHNRVRYYEGGFELRLSFDGVYTCVFPWECVKQLSFFPEPPPPPEPEESQEPPAPVGRPVLTLVKS